MHFEVSFFMTKTVILILIKVDLIFIVESHSRELLNSKYIVKFNFPHSLKLIRDWGQSQRYLNIDFIEISFDVQGSIILRYKDMIQAHS